MPYLFDDFLSKYEKDQLEKKVKNRVCLSTRNPKFWKPNPSLLSYDSIDIWHSSGKYYLHFNAKSTWTNLKRENDDDYGGIEAKGRLLKSLLRIWIFVNIEGSSR